MTPAGEHHERDNTSDRTSDSCDPWRRVSHRGRSSAPGLRRHSRLITASPALTAAAAGANHTCLRQKPSYFSTRRLRRISRAIAFLRGLNALGSTLLPAKTIRDLNLSFPTGPLIRYGFRGNGEAPTRPTTLCRKSSSTRSRLVPTSAAEPAAAEQQQHNDNYEKCGGIHGFCSV